MAGETKTDVSLIRDDGCKAIAYKPDLDLDLTSLIYISEALDPVVRKMMSCPRNTCPVRCLSSLRYVKNFHHGTNQIENFFLHYSVLSIISWIILLRNVGSVRGAVAWDGSVMKIEMYTSFGHMMQVAVL